MAFAPVFGRVFPATFDRRAAVAAAPPASWWEAGGAPTPVAVYQPKGAASLAASYSNLVNSGTYDAAPGDAPSWDAISGWIFNGLSNYLTTGVVPAASWTVLIQYTDFTGPSAISALFGSNQYQWTILPALAPWVDYLLGAVDNLVSPAKSSGNLCIAGSNAYRDGISDGALSGSPTITLETYIGATNGAGTAQGRGAFRCQAFVLYNSTLTADQVLAVSAAMAAL